MWWLLTQGDASCTTAQVDAFKDRYKNDEAVQACVLTTLGDKPRSIHDVLRAYQACTTNAKFTPPPNQQ